MSTSDVSIDCPAFIMGAASTPETIADEIARNLGGHDGDEPQPTGGLRYFMLILCNCGMTEPQRQMIAQHCRRIASETPGGMNWLIMPGAVKGICPSFKLFDMREGKALL